jgi:hypothetical protein
MIFLFQLVVDYERGCCPVHQQTAEIQFFQSQLGPKDKKWILRNAFYNTCYYYSVTPRYCTVFPCAKNSAKYMNDMYICINQTSLRWQNIALNQAPEWVPWDRSTSQNIGLHGGIYQRNRTCKTASGQYKQRGRVQTQQSQHQYIRALQNTHIMKIPRRCKEEHTKMKTEWFDNRYARLSDMVHG